MLSDNLSESNPGESAAAALPAGGQVARIVFDSVTVTHLTDHLKIEIGPLLDPLGLISRPCCLKALSADQFQLDPVQGRSIRSGGIT
jgi:hypothetical protein